MEAYYVYQGLYNLCHRTSPTEGDNTFILCTIDGEKEEERKQFIETMRWILPVSFRIGQNIEEELRLELVRQLDKFAGKEIEIFVLADEKKYKKTAACNADDNLDANKKNGNEVIMENTETNCDTGKSMNRKWDYASLVAKTTTATSEITSLNPTPALTIIKKVAPAKNIPTNLVSIVIIWWNLKLEEFRNRLKIQTEAGFITRQESVSMILPVILVAESP